MVDQTDALSNKAHVFGDKDWHPFWDGVDAAIEGPFEGRSAEQRAMEIRRSDPSRQAWECRDCGRLFLDGAQGTLRVYRPDGEKQIGIFDR